MVDRRDEASGSDLEETVGALSDCPSALFSGRTPVSFKTGAGCVGVPAFAE